MTEKTASLSKKNYCPCFLECFNISDTTHCCHCYSSKYQEQNEEISDKFFICPAMYCLCQSCHEWADDETRQHSSSRCCGEPTDPPCHDCSLFCFPCGIVTDVLCLIPRLFIYKIKKPDVTLEKTDIK